MFYDRALTIPANTARASVVSSELVLTYGVIHRVEVEFPEGCAGLAHFRVRRFEHQVWPTNPGGDFATNGHVITWNDYLQMYDEPFTLQLEGWNVDNTFPHTITLRVGVLPRSVAEHLYGRPSKREVDALRAAFTLAVSES